MLSKDFEWHNGNHNGHSNGTHLLECQSDYEPRPQIIDVVPSEPQPRWRDQYPILTHNLNWIDGDGHSHSFTVRSDDIDELLHTLKTVKVYIKASKAKSQSEEKSEDTPDVKPCLIHDTDMARRWSKRTNGHYFAHKLDNGDFCYGRERR